MARHAYRIIVQELRTPGGPATEAQPLDFEVTCHDDLFAIVGRLEKRGDFSSETARVFGLGLKLFAETMLGHRDSPLFADLVPHFKQFMQKLKQPRPGDPA